MTVLSVAIIVEFGSTLPLNVPRTETFQYSFLISYFLEKNCGPPSSEDSRLISCMEIKTKI